MIACRLVKLAMVASIALFAFVVTLDNIVDYQSNYDFVRHVLSMDTTFPGNALRPGRAITAPWAWTAAYWIIIGVEGLTCAAFAVATAALTRALRADAAGFARRCGGLCAGEAIRLHRRRHRLSAVVYRVHGGRRRVFRHVAIADMEWAGSGIPLLSDAAGRADLCQSTGCRDATISAQPRSQEIVAECV